MVWHVLSISEALNSFSTSVLDNKLIKTALANVQSDDQQNQIINSKYQAEALPSTDTDAYLTLHPLGPPQHRATEVTTNKLACLKKRPITRRRVSLETEGILHCRDWVRDSLGR